MQTRHPRHKRAIYFLFGCAALLVFVHLTTQFCVNVLGTYPKIQIGGVHFDPVFWFDLNRERRAAAGFSTFIIVIASCCAAYVAINTSLSKAMRLGWGFVSAMVMFMAFDEFFQIHEQSGQFAGDGTHYGAVVVPGWVRVMGLVVAALLIPLGFFWWRLPRQLRIRTVVAAVVFLGGAMGVEIISSKLVMNAGTEHAAIFVLIAIEEGMEMLGMLIFIDAVMLHISSTACLSESPAGSDPEAIPSR